VFYLTFGFEFLSFLGKELSGDHGKLEQRKKVELFSKIVKEFVFVPDVCGHPQRLGKNLLPNLFIDEIGFEDQKFSAINTYDVEIHTFQHSRPEESSMSLLKWHGASSNLGIVEAFVSTRGIW